MSSLPNANSSNKSTADAAKTIQVERELATARSQLVSAELELTAFRNKLSIRERELLKMENEIMAFEQEKITLVEEFKTKSAYARDENKEMKSEMMRAQEEMKVAGQQRMQDANNVKTDLMRDIEKMRIALEKKEKDLERSESNRERITDQLKVIESESKEAQTKNLKLVASVTAEKGEMERGMIQLRDDLKKEMAKEAQREKLELALKEAKKLIEESRLKSTEEIRSLKDEKTEIERSLIASREELKVEVTKRIGRGADGDARINSLTSQLAVLESKLAESLSSIDALKLVEFTSPVIVDNSAEMKKLEDQIVELVKEAAESTRAIREFESLRDTFETSNAMHNTEVDGLRDVLGKNVAELKQIK
jgi:chromosome segregation ATPase